MQLFIHLPRVLLTIHFWIPPPSAKRFSGKSCYSHLIPCGPYCWARTATSADTWLSRTSEESWSKGRRSF